MLKLSNQERSLLREWQRSESYRREYIKVTTILLLDMEKTPDEIGLMLGIDHTTVYRYQQHYKQLGIDKYLSINYEGYWGKLNSHQISLLRKELNDNFYTSAQAVADYILSVFAIEYSAEGMVDLLGRIGFSYKKTSIVPPNADSAKQEAFVAEFEEFKAQLPVDEVIFFMDACHPQHNTRPAYGWIETGTKREIRSNSGRNRVNINAVINLEDPTEVISLDAATINALNTVALFELIRQKQQTKKTIHIFCDSARYYKSKLVTQWLEGKNIVLHFLPTYSPNLNLIERLWKFLRKKVIDTHYFAQFDDFKKAVMGFLDNLSPYREELTSLMNPKFAIFQKVTI